ncbi:hypothetical protein ACIGGE_10645 [Qipengyuania sp. NPDC077410]|uniref:hypothetical protein n=1 Tax=Qipengyuania sp. NPDC077410 TaxID=3364496 RepID=UPI0037C61CC5
MAKKLIYSNRAGIRNESCPFVYLLGWPDLNQFYIGVRFGKGCHPDDLWTRYFSSSYRVHEIAQEYGPPPVRDIIGIYSSEAEAREAEKTLLRENKVHRLSNFVNLTTGGPAPMTDEQRANHSKALKRAYESTELREKLSAAVKASWAGDDERRRQMSRRARKMGQQRARKYFTWKGQEWTAEQLVTGSHLTPHQFLNRMNQGYTIEDALTTPLRKRSRTRKNS